MNETVKELITQNIYETLAEISTLNGFQNDATAARATLRGNPIKDRNYKIIDDGDEPIDDSPVNKDDYTANFRIVFKVAADDGPDAEPIDVDRARAVADLRKALMADYSRGGWAINTKVRGNTQLPDSQSNGIAGEQVPVEIHYRTAKDNPYSL